MAAFEQYPFGALYAYGLNNPYAPSNTLLGTIPKKRKAFFSFHYDDIMRVNNVRNIWKIDHPDSPLVRNFQDYSLWESKKLESDDAVKNLFAKE